MIDTQVKTSAGRGPNGIKPFRRLDQRLDVGHSHQPNTYAFATFGIGRGVLLMQPTDPIRKPFRERIANISAVLRWARDSYNLHLSSGWGFAQLAEALFNERLMLGSETLGSVDRMALAAKLIEPSARDC